MKKTDFFSRNLFTTTYIYIKYVAKVKKKIELTKKKKRKEKKLTYIKQRPPHFFTKAWRFSLKHNR
ncbi:hypothetical protein DWY11_10825 [Segatella copri]|uniref:Uncharacterized protein n=1 Tax=Segatella copri TaxID=165179 RepID=A0A412HD55_9BACT|nr:hypothetical protein DWY11_10825 [Segatella copri]RHK06430.1 hypothetical protein DW079_14505 [Segatella copri]